jgi:hypothetical protein
VVEGLTLRSTHLASYPHMTASGSFDIIASWCWVCIFAWLAVRFLPGVFHRLRQRGQVRRESR